MSKIQIISFILAILLSCFVGFALKLLQLEPLNTTILRLFVLSGVTLITILALMVSTRLYDKKEKIILLCFVCLMAVVAMTICETLIKRLTFDRKYITGVRGGSI
jgi:hypothetical protein